MGVTLTGKAIKNTYEGLLKLTDNEPINASMKKVTDGFGNETGLALSSTGVLADALYNTQTTAQITADASDAVVPNRAWVQANNAAATSFVALTDTFSNMGSRRFGNLKVNSAGTAIIAAYSHYDFACGDETSDLTVGNATNIEFPYVMESFWYSAFTVTTAPTGSPIVIDLLKNGVSVYNGASRPTIDVGTTSTINSSVSTSFTSDTFDIAQGDVLSVNITQVGSTIKGTALKCFLTYDVNVMY